ncbi:outer membrane protein assembly factor BamB [Actinomadura pelletieri DSM 43383]|uniref:Outer membrane protein assembly factor BamB n=1 Tax=Actinomadura pelletieri DSM 43383 TaxID=1120940 RepID=A0A495QBL8_9ACTN|nr:PQQ-binding-like beta-propeller repeat protein [Actinomadura pelletieri]RKS69070.1 outer membrane protein assembly factor BamB [Actinomadura pelletieri DSM 43383]
MFAVMAFFVVRDVFFGGGTSSGPTARLAWWLDNARAPSSPHDPLAWPSGDALVLAAGRQVTGYGVVDGTRRWAVALPGDLCAASKVMSGGRIAVLHGGGTFECDRVQVIDVGRGATVWQRPLPPWDSSDDKETQVVIADETVAVQREDEGINAFRLRDGRPVWRHIGLLKGCLYSGVGGGAALVAELKCRGGLTTAMQLLGANDGRPRWTRQLGEDTGLSGIFSTDPVIVGLGDGYGGQVQEVMMLDEAGAPVGRVRLSRDTSRFVHCPDGEVTWCNGIVLNGTTVYLRVASGTFSGQKVVAHDLSTGRLLWESDLGAQAQPVPVAWEGGRLIAAHPPLTLKRRSPNPGAVVALDPRTGRSTRLLSIPTSMAGVHEMIKQEARPYWVNGHFVLVRQEFRTRPEPVLAAFGPPTEKPAGKK